MFLMTIVAQEGIAIPWATTEAITWKVREWKTLKENENCVYYLITLDNKSNISLTLFAPTESVP